VHLLVCIFFYARQLSGRFVSVSLAHQVSLLTLHMATCGLILEYISFFSRFESASENLLRRLICSVTVCVSAGFRLLHFFRPLPVQRGSPFVFIPPLSFASVFSDCVEAV
jgi:hypothetical protein